MKNKMLLLASAGSLGVLAEGTTPTMDVTAGTGIINAATTGLESLLTACTPYITTLILAGLAIWAAIVILKVVKRVFSRAA